MSYYAAIYITYICNYIRVVVICIRQTDNSPIPLRVGRNLFGLNGDVKRTSYILPTHGFKGCKNISFIYTESPFKIVLLDSVYSNIRGLTKGP